MTGTGWGVPERKGPGDVRDAGKEGEMGEIGKIAQHSVIFCNRKSTKKREPTKIG